MSKAKNNQYILPFNLFHQKSTCDDGVSSSPELWVTDPNNQTRAGAPQRRLRRGKEGKERSTGDLQGRNKATLQEAGNEGRT